MSKQFSSDSNGNVVLTVDRIVTTVRGTQTQFDLIPTLPASSSNTFGGNTAGNGGSVTGTNDTCYGSAAGAALTTGSHNTFIGASAGSLVTSGSSNVHVGRASSSIITTGSNNTILGATASAGASGASQRTALGFGATCTADNQVMLGTTTEQVVVPGTVALPLKLTAPAVVAQLTNNNTAVTCVGNVFRISSFGSYTTAGDTVDAGFTVNHSAVTATSVISVTPVYAGTGQLVAKIGTVGTGSFTIVPSNASTSGTALNAGVIWNCMVF